MRDKYRSLSEEEKNKKRECGKNVWRKETKTKRISKRISKNYHDAKERYSKEKAAEYYAQNKEAIKEKSRKRYKNLSQKEKDKIKEYQRKRYQELVQYKKVALKKEIIFCSLHSIKNDWKNTKI